MTKANEPSHSKKNHQAPPETPGASATSGPAASAEDRRRGPTRVEDGTPALLRYADFNYAEFFRRRNVRVLVTFLIVMGVILFGFWLSAIFVPLLTALLLAYILNPLVMALERKGLTRFKAVLMIFACFFLLAGVVLIVSVPAIASNMSRFAEEAPTYPAKFEDAVHSFLRWYNPKVPEGMRVDEGAVRIEALRDYIQNEILKTKETPEATGEAAASAVNFSLGVFGSILRVLLFVTLVPLYTFYFMLGLNGIWNRIQQYLPGRQRERLLGILREIHVMVSAFFRGRLTICTLIAALTVLLYLSFGVPFAILLGIVGGIGVIIPFFSIIASLFPAVLLMLIDRQDHSTLSIVMVISIFTVIQAAEQYVITPRVLGKAVELHPVTLLVGVFVMAQLFGVFGALLAVPLTAIAKILGREFILPYFKSLAAEDGAKARPG